MNIIISQEIETPDKQNCTIEEELYPYPMYMDQKNSNGQMVFIMIPIFLPYTQNNKDRLTHIPTLSKVTKPIEIPICLCHPDVSKE